MFFGKRFSGHHGSSLSGLEILVLTLIKNESDITGYDIIQEINKEFKPIWKASAGTIYPLLERLVNSSYVNVKEIIDENNRKKKTYTISAKGRDESEKILKGNFEPSLKTLGNFIRTIMKGIKFDDNMDRMFSCFPFCHHNYDQEIDENDISRENVERVQKIINNLKHRRDSLKHRLGKAKNQINYYEDILHKINELREKNAKPIPIIEDDDEFENF